MAIWSNYWTESILLATFYLILIVAWFLWNRLQSSNFIPPAERASLNRLKRKPVCFDIGFNKLGLILARYFSLCIEQNAHLVTSIFFSGKQVLDGVTGAVRSGRTTAVMGPSGSGKVFS